MTQSKRNSKSQQGKTELPFDTPLNPQTSFLVDSPESNYRNISLNEDVPLSDEE